MCVFPRSQLKANIANMDYWNRQGLRIWKSGVSQSSKILITTLFTFGLVKIVNQIFGSSFFFFFLSFVRTSSVIERGLHFLEITFCQWWATPDKCRLSLMPEFQKIIRFQENQFYSTLPLPRSPGSLSGHRKEWGYVVRVVHPKLQEFD